MRASSVFSKASIAADAFASAKSATATSTNYIATVHAGQMFQI